MFCGEEAIFQSLGPSGFNWTIEKEEGTAKTNRLVACHYKKESDLAYMAKNSLRLETGIAVELAHCNKSLAETVEELKVFTDGHGQRVALAIGIKSLLPMEPEGVMVSQSKLKLF